MAKKNKRKSSGGHEVLTIQNAATTLLANIRFADMDNPIKTVVITSSVSGEGKSTISANLAQIMAAGGKKTLIVDCDSRNRSVALTFGAKPAYGLFAVLSKQVSLAQAVCAVEPQGLYILDIEPSIPNPADIFASKRFASFLAEAREVYDYVVIDTPPVTAFIDAAVIASHADACVLVVGENHTRREFVTYTCEQLRKADANLIGICMNYCGGSSSYGYGSYGYGYGYGGGYGPADSQSYNRPYFDRRSRAESGKRFKS